MIKSSWKPVIGLIILTALLGISGCDRGGNEEAGNQASLPTVVVAEVVSQDIRDTARYIGRAEAIDTVDIQARVEGYLENIAILDGQSVEQGQILFTIEPAPYSADLAQARASASEAKAALDLATIELERRGQLVSRQSISQSEYDIAAANRASAEAQLDVAYARVEQAEIRLGYTEIKAPFEGRLGRIERSVGDVVGPGSGPLANLTRISPIYVAFSVAERDFVSILEEAGNPDGSIDAAKSATVNLELPNGHALPDVGKLVFVDNRVDPATATIAVLAQFENTSGILVPGAYLNVEIGDPDTESRLVIPQAALQQDQQGKFALVVGDTGIVEQRYISLGKTVGTDIVVTQGFDSGEKVIIEGLQRVRLGQPVEAVPATQPEDTATGETPAAQGD